MITDLSKFRSFATLSTIGLSLSTMYCAVVDVDEVEDSFELISPIIDIEEAILFQTDVYLTCSKQSDKIEMTRKMYENILSSLTNDK